MSNNKGIVYITISVMTTLIFLVFSSMLSVGATESRTVSELALANKSYYIADSGFNIAVNFILNQRNVSAGYSETKINFDNIFAAQNYPLNYNMTWQIQSNNANTLYGISSTGQYNGHKKNILATISIDMAGLVSITDYKLVNV